MFKYAFILGRNPALSVAEILSAFSRNQIIMDILESSSEVLLVETKTPLSAGSFLSTLGGTIKVAEILYPLQLDKSEDELFKIFSVKNLLINFFPSHKGKIHFGLSLYYIDENIDSIKSYRKLLANLSSHIKKELQSQGYSSGFVRIKDRFLSSVSVDKNELLKKGAEIILISSKTLLYVGKTSALQQFESYGIRDYGRPRRDKKSGILPPKIAQIMLNLSEAAPNATILDPFCGSGTILSEAAFMGFKNIIGTDIKDEAVSATRENLDWLQKQFPQNLAALNIKLFTSDVTRIASRLSPNSVDTIITEPYLGPPFYKTPSDYEINSVSNQLGNLYQNAFREFSKIIKNKSKVVIIFPAFKSGSQFKLINILDQLSKLGFRLQQILPEDLQHKYSQYLSSRKTFIYGRGDEFVFREIFVFENLKS